MKKGTILSVVACIALGVLAVLCLFDGEPDSGRHSLCSGAASLMCVINARRIAKQRGE